MEDSKIGWTDNTKNFWLGCAKIHEGCRDCYAEHMMDTRFGRVNWGEHTPRVVTSPKNWKETLRWNRESDPDNPTVVFTNSLADMFENNRAQCLNHHQKKLYLGPGDEFLTADDPRIDETQSMPVRLTDVRGKAMKMIAECQNLRWVILTKRPADIPLCWPYRYVECERCHGALEHLKAVPKDAEGKTAESEMVACMCNHDRPGSMRELVAMPNVWICISISMQKHYDYMMSEFLVALERMRPFVGGLGLSIEPQIEHIDLRIPEIIQQHSTEDVTYDYPFKWIKSGGESKQGKDAKPRKFDLAWPESLILQTEPYDDIDFFFKQCGENCVWTCGGKERAFYPAPNDKKGEDMKSIPPTIRLRQSPFKEEVRDPDAVQEFELAD